MKASTAFNRKNSGVNSIQQEKKSGVNGVQPEKLRRSRRLTGKMAALTVLNCKNSGVNGVEPEKKRR